MHDSTPGISEHLERGMVAGYVGFDPTGDSLHVGHLLPIMMLTHLQRAGHKPYVLVGGATGMVGDPSGKSAERNLLDEETLRANVEKLKAQLSRFLDFDCGPNSAVLVNNYEWTKDVTLLDFLRKIGKHITISYMMAKDSVKKRIETGISFTEFSYQLLQGFDFYHLCTQHNVTLQMGASDQWGNITTGTELIRRMDGGEAFAVTCPLLLKPDGTKFGKTADGASVWLDADKTSPYRFYQFYLNLSDEQAAELLKKYTLMEQTPVNELIELHNQNPGARPMQKALAADVTRRVHGEEALADALRTTELLFGSMGIDNKESLNENTLRMAMEGIPVYTLKKDLLQQSIPLLDLITDKVGEANAGQEGIYKSKGEARKAIAAGSFYINKVKWTDGAAPLTSADLLLDKYLMLQTGKKNFKFLIFEP